MRFFARAPWAGCGLLVGCALAASAQVLSPPPQLAPTVSALNALHECSRQASRKAGGVAAEIDNARQQLFYGLAKGGYSSGFGSGGGGYGNGEYRHNGDWLLVPPPRQYVADLTHEAQWCLQVANILNTDPTRTEAAKQVLTSIAKDLEIKAKDCKDWGAGRLVTVIASTLKNGQPDPGWTVMYKWVSVSGLNATELSFPKISTPTSQGVPPGIYSVYATKQVGNSTVKTSAVTVSAFQNQKVKCEIPVP
jgi:hypothetical protein